MNKELLIDVTQSEVNIALLENRKLVELHSESANSSFNVGDIYLGRVTKLNNGLNAAFVEIGFEKEAFLHYTDMGPFSRSFLKFTNEAIQGQQDFELKKFQLQPEILKLGKIDQVLQKKQAVLVQILKEPISSKGPRLTLEISLAGRYLVLTPFVRGINISKKITTSEERKRLQKTLDGIVHKNFGVIVRTAAEGKLQEEIQRDLHELMEKWKTITLGLKNANTSDKILSELDKTTSILRDLLNNDFEKIIVNNTSVFNDINNFLAKVAPEKRKIVELIQNDVSPFDTYGVTKQIKSSFGKTSTTTGGSYIVIEHTEAMTVIDVNSGNRAKGDDQDSVAFKVNSEVCEEIARQLRLRDIGGLIVIDFIDMKNVDFRKKIFERITELMRKDTARHSILPISKFGIMQITRERTKPVVTVETSEKCPSCNGTGKINASILIEDEIERNLQFIINRQNPTKLSLQVHPYVHAFLMKGFITKKIIWWWTYKKWITIIPNTKLGISEYKFINDQDEEIKL